MDFATRIKSGQEPFIGSDDIKGNGKGVAESSILDNQEAKTYYEQHRT